MENSYGLWSIVIINSLIFIIFAFSFTKPKTSKDWRSLGMFSILVWMYVRLAESEERETEKEFGVQWTEYARRTPAFTPIFRVN